MDTEISIINDGGRLSVYTPYDPTFPAAAKELGGRWDAMDRAWTFDARDEQRVRDLVRSIYGTDGSDATDEAQLVTVRVNMDDVRSGQELRLAGRRLAWRPSRDEQVRLAEGVVVISGGFPDSGGSLANPRLREYSETVLEVRDLPLPVAQKMAEETKAAVLVDAAELERSVLLAERDRLLTRLAEIDAELGETGSSYASGVVI